MVINALLFAIWGASNAPVDPSYALIALDPDAGTAVFESATRGLFVVRRDQPIADSGFNLSLVSADGVTVVLGRSYQGQSLSVSLARGEELTPAKIVEMEQADQRAAHALDALVRVAPAVAEPD